MKTAAELPFIAGHVALDFVNTAEERGHPDASDALGTPGRQVGASLAITI